MHRLWDTLIEDVVGLVSADVAVEVGSQRGWLTEQLLEHYEGTQTVVHVIDPAPAYDPASWAERYGDRLQFHRGLSLDVLTHLPPVDIAFLDGDHNWYTVYHELRLLEEQALRAGRAMPVVVLHDVDWPYGRRDLYYDPASIPSEERQPHRRAGVLPGSSELVADGINEHLVNAVHEGGPRNGVRTAVEDFLHSSEADIEHLSIPGLHGLSVLAPRGRLFEELRSRLLDPAVLTSHLQVIENARLTELRRAHASGKESSRRKAEESRLRERELEVRRDLETVGQERDIVRRELELTRESLKENRDLAASLSRDLKRAARMVEAEHQRDARVLVKRVIQWITRRPQPVRSSVSEELRAARTVAKEIRTHSKLGLSHQVKGPPASLDKRVAAEQTERDYLRDQMRETGMPLALSELPVPVERTGRLRERDARPDDRPTADVVVCVHDALHDVWRCLGSLFDAAEYPLHLIVVDDGSAAPTREFLERFAEDNSSVTLVRNADPPHGYTIAANLGLQASRGDYVVFLNSDTIVTRGWLERLVACGESQPDVGVFGPLSNAASHQSVPSVRAEGGWATNPLPPWLTADAMALLVADTGRESYPRLPFINGFCYVVKREVIDHVGRFDDERFAAGYCEENDYSQRARLGGYELAVAADTYVYHAKSRSYGVEGRRPIAKEHYRRFTAKHGEAEIERLVGELEENRALAPVRARLAEATADFETFRRAFTAVGLPSLRVLFVLPGLAQGGGGGAHSIYQEAAAMRSLDIDARVAVRSAHLDRARALYRDADDVFRPYDGSSGLMELAGGFDVVVATHYRSVAEVAEVAAELEGILPAYYVQDYEPFFARAREDELREARGSYTAIPGQLLFAKTRWLCEMVGRRHGVRVAKVEPSLDREVYHARGRPERGIGDPLRVVAMVRPRTPRRQPYTTLAVLEELATSLGHDVQVSLFGCEAKELRGLGGAHSIRALQLGILSREQVADTLRANDVFVDLSSYQAFGRTALEAMACGCVPVVPGLGGAHEFAEEGHNAVVVDTADPEAALGALLTLASDREDLARLQRGGLETTNRYSTQAAALSEYLLFAEEFRALQGGPDADEIRTDGANAAIGLDPSKPSGRRKQTPIEVSSEETAKLVSEWIREQAPVAVVRFGEGEGRLLVANPGDPTSMSVAARKLRRQTGCLFTSTEVLEVRDMVLRALDRADVVGIRGSSSFSLEHQDWVARIEKIFEERAVADGGATHVSHCLLSNSLRDALPDLIGGAAEVSVVSCRNLKPVIETVYEVKDVVVYQVPSQYIMRNVDDEYERGLHRVPFSLDFYRELRQEITVRRKGEVFLIGAGILGKDLCIRVRELGGIALDLGSCLDGLAGKVTRGLGRPEPYRK